mgnify:CR=1 FL=1
MVPPLVLVAFFDEAWSGVPVVDAPAIEAEHGLSHGLTALLILTMPQLLGAVLEARVLLWAHRGHAKRYAVGGLLALAVAVALAAWAPSPWILGLALALAGPASGVACALAEGALVEADPSRREVEMTRWTLAGALGDLLAPTLVAGVGVAGLGWRTAMLVVAGALGLYALWLSRRELAGLPSGEGDDGDDDDDGPQDLRSTLENRTLVWWLVGTTSCALLDEILVALAALRLRQDLHAPEAVTGFALGAWAFGAGVGLLATQWLLRHVAPRRLLVVAGVACTLASSSWLWTSSPLGVTLGIFAIGLTAAPLYPVATAQVYAACPGRPALIGAAEQVFAPIEIALPWLVGALADRVGLQWALVGLALQPIVLGTLALRAWPRSRPRR